MYETSPVSESFGVSPFLLSLYFLLEIPDGLVLLFLLLFTECSGRKDEVYGNGSVSGRPRCVVSIWVHVLSLFLGAPSLSISTSYLLSVHIPLFSIIVSIRIFTTWEISSELYLQKSKNHIPYDNNLRIELCIR